MEARKDVPSSSMEVVQRPVEQPPGFHPSRSTTVPPHMGERTTQDNRVSCPPVGTRVPTLSTAERQGVGPLAENAWGQSGIPIKSSPLIQGSVNTQPKMELPTASVLSVCCRTCEAPPTVTTQPTVTTCGHLFCSECVPRTLGSTTCGLTPRQVHNATRGIYV